MAAAKPEFQRLLFAVFEGQCETSIEGLMAAVTFEGVGLLDQLPELDQFLEASGIEVRPPISVGELGDTRVLIYANRNVGFGSRLVELRSIGELSEVEYKSTCFVSVRQVREGGMDPSKCWSDAVVESTIKTICGFLNRDGGEIFVGVENDRSVCGIELDYEVLRPKDRNFDGWVNRLIELIKSSFHESTEVLTYLDFDFEKVEDRDVVRIVVRPRSKLSFAKDANGDFRCFFRTGARITSIGIEELPEILRARWNLQ